MNDFVEVLREAAPIVLGVFLVYLAFALPAWLARGAETVLDWGARVFGRR